MSKRLNDHIQRIGAQALNEQARRKGRRPRLGSEYAKDATRQAGIHALSVMAMKALVVPTLVIGSYVGYKDLGPTTHDRPSEQPSGLVKYDNSTSIEPSYTLSQHAGNQPQHDTAPQP